MYIYIFIYVYYTHVCINVCMYVSIYVCMHACACACISVVFPVHMWTLPLPVLRIAIVNPACYRPGFCCSSRHSYARLAFAFIHCSSSSAIFQLSSFLSSSSTDYPISYFPSFFTRPSPLPHQLISFLVHLLVLPHPPSCLPFAATPHLFLFILLLLRSSLLLFHLPFILRISLFMYRIPTIYIHNRFPLTPSSSSHLPLIQDRR